MRDVDAAESVRETASNLRAAVSAITDTDASAADGIRAAIGPGHPAGNQPS